MEGLPFNRHVVKANHLGLFDDELGRRPLLKRYTFQKKSWGICNYQQDIEKYSARANNLRSLDGDVIHKQIVQQTPPPSCSSIFVVVFFIFSLVHGNEFIHPARRQNSNDARVCRINSFLQSFFFLPLYFDFQIVSSLSPF